MLIFLGLNIASKIPSETWKIDEDRVPPVKSVAFGHECSE